MARTFFTPGSRQQVGGIAPKTMIQVTNSREIEKRFRKLTKDVQGRILVASMMDGAEVIRRRTADMAPRPTVRRHPEVGRLADNIIKMVLFRGQGEVQVGILPDYRESRVGHLVEHGHKWWWGGFQEEKPFMGPAFDATKQRAMQVIQNRLQKEVTRDVKSLNKEG